MNSYIQNQKEVKYMMMYLRLLVKQENIVYVKLGIKGTKLT
jgi:hypothetical protein